MISCKIGDSRLASMETMAAVTRALSEVVAHGCDLINMSYGEATSIANEGLFVRLAEQVDQETFLWDVLEFGASKYIMCCDLN